MGGGPDCWPELGLSMDPHMELSKLRATARQMISIAIACEKTANMMLDEPTSSLDKKNWNIIFHHKKLKDRAYHFFLPPIV